MAINPLVYVPTAWPTDSRSGEQMLRKLNEKLQLREDNLVLGVSTILAERLGIPLSDILSRLTDDGKIEDQRALPQVSAGNVLSLQNINPLTAAADAVNATITIASHNVQYGFGQVSYQSGAISGLVPSTDYFVYADDPEYAGGAVSYFATTTRQTVTASNGRYFVGTITTAISATARLMSAATQANPCAVTVTASHGWTTGDQVTVTGVVGMTALNGNTYTISVTGAATFTLNVNSTGFGAYVSGGTVTRVSTATDGGTGAGGGWIDGGGFE